MYAEKLASYITVIAAIESGLVVLPPKPQPQTPTNAERVLELTKASFLQPNQFKDNFLKDLK